MARRYRLNQWTESQETWLPAPWSAFEAENRYTIEAKTGQRIVAAMDGSRRYDSTAIAWCAATKDRDGLLHGRVKSRTWERPVDPRTGQPDESWSIPYDEVRGHLYAMHFGTAEDAPWTDAGACVCCGEEFAPLELEAVGFDPAYLSQFADDLESDGLPMVEIPQTDSRMVPGFQMLYELLTDGRLEHDGDETLARHVLNSTVR